LGKKGGRNKLKRLAAPRSWDIPRKENRFVFKPLAGPHSISSSYPLGVVVRDLARLANTEKEIKQVVKTGKVLVDGMPRRSPSFPVGLFDVLSVPLEGVVYRMVPSPKGLRLSKIPAEEGKKKLCNVRSKVRTKGGHIQYGLHDGRSILNDTLQLSPGDSVLIEVPTQNVAGQVKLGKDSLGLVLSGDRAGQVGRILEVKVGTISRERMVKISLPGGEAEVPSRLVIPVGTNEPIITVGVSAS
jgi:small subunit ribosomal protein S4e